MIILESKVSYFFFGRLLYGGKLAFFVYGLGWSRDGDGYVQTLRIFLSCTYQRSKVLVSACKVLAFYHHNLRSQ